VHLETDHRRDDQQLQDVFLLEGTSSQHKSMGIDERGKEAGFRIALVATARGSECVFDRLKIFGNRFRGEGDLAREKPRVHVLANDFISVLLLEVLCVVVVVVAAIVGLGVSSNGRSRIVIAVDRSRED